jgi:N6-L-threonylcarbamoyladenine synthase
MGCSSRRGLALATGLPLHGIHHMEGHLLSPFLGDRELAARELRAASGAVGLGRAHRAVRGDGARALSVLGRTRDDAAGEAFDKVAKMLGLGYPGGPVIDRLAAEGDPQRGDAFRGRCSIASSFEFSFSGLKTAVLVHMERTGSRARARHWRICARRFRRRWWRCWWRRRGSRAAARVGRDARSSAGCRPIAGCARRWQAAATPDGFELWRRRCATAATMRR